jgi:ATP-binding cassette subfamily F protein 3
MKLGYFGQTNIQRLNPKLTIEQEIEHTNPALTRTQVRNICGTMMFGGDLALKKVSVSSGR